MKTQEKRQAAFVLHRTGKPNKAIARLLKMDVKTVRRVVRDGPGAAPATRCDKISLPEPLLRDVHARCQGYIQRMHEVLVEEHGVRVGYSTLTRQVRALSLGETISLRCLHAGDTPGAEMQHDTSPYRVSIGGKETSVICSGLYLRYSKMRYVKFYRQFNRFAMKCFMDEALRFWGCCAGTCVIDNTNLAVLYGTGAGASFVPEMASFAGHYGFAWKAHAIGHSNRKAGTERNFWTVETNFLPGRSFADMDDLNRQAFEWATKRYAQRPQAKTGLVPIQAFETEKGYLVNLPDYVPAPCREHLRGLDDYGYAAFDGNYYWVPEHGKGEGRIRDVKIIEYAGHIVIHHAGIEPLRYDLPKSDVRNERFTPDGVKLTHQPRNRKKPSGDEEKALRAMGSEVDGYVDFIKSADSGIHYPHHVLRELYNLLRKMSPLLVAQTMERALKYRVCRLDAITRIAAACLKPNGSGEFEADVTPDYVEREAYHRGRFSDEPGFDGLCDLVTRHGVEPQTPP